MKQFEARMHVLATALVMLSAACSGGGGGGGGSGGGGGTGPTVITESEPNNTPNTANFGGSYDPGTHVQLNGHVNQFVPGGPGDIFDAYRITAHTSCKITFSLSGENPSADMALDLYDLNAQFVTSYNFHGAGSPEVGTNVAGTGDVFYLVVGSLTAETEYTLDLVASDPADSPEQSCGQASSGTAERIASLPAVDRVRVEAFLNGCAAQRELDPVILRRLISLQFDDKGGLIVQTASQTSEGWTVVTRSK